MNVMMFIQNLYAYPYKPTCQIVPYLLRASSVDVMHWRSAIEIRARRRSGVMWGSPLLDTIIEDDMDGYRGV